MHDAHVMTLADGRELGWLEVGDPGGRPVLVFHGTPGSKLQVAFGEPAAVSTGVRFVAPDRPGYGLSTFQRDRRLVDWPADVEQLADHLNIDRFSVMGLSGGGPHALVCAALLADRVEAAAIVSGAGPLADPRAEQDMMALNRFIARLARRRSRVLTVLAIAQTAFARRWPTKAIELMVGQLPEADVTIVRRPDVRQMLELDISRASRTTGLAAAQDFELFTADWGFALDRIHVPVSFWQGTADRNVPAQHATLMHDCVPASTLHALDGEGHFLVVDRLAEILRDLCDRGATT